MPRAMKAYTVNNGGSIPGDHVREAIGEKPWRRQMDVVVIAATKKDAVALLATVRVHPCDVLRHSPGYPLGESIRVFAAGVPGVYAMRSNNANGGPVVIVHDGSCTPVGVVGEVTVDGRRSKR